MKKDKNTVVLEPIKIQTATVTIDGDTDLVLNKMNARAERTLTDERTGEGKKVKQVPNIWEDIITAMHWRDGLQMKDSYIESTEERLVSMLQNNAPCITAFGLGKSFGQAVTRNEIDKYATKFDNAVNVLSHGGLIPIKFTEHCVDTRLMSPKRGAPVLVHLNRFAGWTAQFQIQYTEHVYSLEEIVNIINLAGFGLGIGSGRTSGYGRYHVADVK